ncbi:MAG: hypothetical protein M1824_003252 [Vezdaea acicularis]|nr:MAG: hypothetical protein M1824_003252 [Vezdaea acicularis]
MWPPHCPAPPFLSALLTLLLLSTPSLSTNDASTSTGRTPRQRGAGASSSTDPDDTPLLQGERLRHHIQSGPFSTSFINAATRLALPLYTLECTPLGTEPLTYYLSSPSNRRYIFHSGPSPDPAHELIYSFPSVRSLCATRSLGGSAIWNAGFYCDASRRPPKLKIDTSSSTALTPSAAPIAHYLTDPEILDLCRAQCFCIGGLDDPALPSTEAARLRLKQIRRGAGRSLGKLKDGIGGLFSKPGQRVTYETAGTAQGGQEAPPVLPLTTTASRRTCGWDGLPKSQCTSFSHSGCPDGCACYAEYGVADVALPIGICGQSESAGYGRKRDLDYVRGERGDGEYAKPVAGQ